MKKWGKPDGKKVRTTATPMDAPLDLSSDEAIRKFSKQRLVDLARSGGDTAARQAASELLERVEPKAVAKAEQLTRSESQRICDVYDNLFGETRCPACGHKFIKADL